MVAAFEKGETVTLRMDDTDIVLNKEDVLVEAVKKEGYTSQVDGKLTVVLDTKLTDALIEEGYAREFISKVQSMRKDTGFDVTDHIAVTCQCGEKLAAALLEKGWKGRYLHQAVEVNVLPHATVPEIRRCLHLDAASLADIVKGVQL